MMLGRIGLGFKNWPMSNSGNPLTLHHHNVTQITTKIQPVLASPTLHPPKTLIGIRRRLFELCCRRTGRQADTCLVKQTALG